MCIFLLHHRQFIQHSFLVLPTFLDRFPHPLCIFSSIVLVQVGSFDVRGWAGIRIIQETGGRLERLWWNNIILSSCIPLNTRQDSCHIVCWGPSILQNIQTKLSRRIHIWMKHLADELNRRWFLWVLFFEMHNESEGSILKGGVGWSDNDSVPGEGTSTSLL